MKSPAMTFAEDTPNQLPLTVRNISFVHFFFTLLLFTLQFQQLRVFHFFILKAKTTNIAPPKIYTTARMPLKCCIYISIDLACPGLSVARVREFFLWNVKIKLK